MVTGLVGVVMFWVGIVMLSISSQSLQLYIPSMVFLSGCANLVGLPVLTVRYLFPQKAGLAISIVMSSQTLSTVVPIVLDEIMKAYPSASIGLLFGVFLGAVAVPVGILFVLSLPMERPYVVPTMKADEKLSIFASDADCALPRDTGDNKQAHHTGDNKQAHHTGDNKQAHHTGDNKRAHHTGDNKQAHHTGDNNSSVGVTTDVVLSSSVCDDSPDEAQRMASAKLHGVDNAVETSTMVPVDTEDFRDAQPEPTGVDWKQFWKEVRTPEFLSFLTFFVITQLQLGYYPTTVFGRNGEDVSDFLGYVGPTQALWGVVIGFLYDCVGVIWTIFLMIGLTFLVFAFALVPFTPLQYATAMLYVFAYSYIFTTSYIYVDETFAQRNFGTIIGVIISTTGITYLVNLPFQYPGVFVTMYIVYISLCAVTFAAAVWMFIRRRQGHNYCHWGLEEEDKVVTTTMCLSFESGKSPSSAIYSARGEDTIIAVAEEDKV
eukprot:CAMPEP_0113856766 /NCGR_PEP_ID=MMETSP0372-20130328/9511_1 /TAXON_ID=340204 /ORGANISM="Lankesteria abbotti" /LENGTH=488 /DNA_ID=CAMNT_0000831989 /DNA_START=310 /DNA_END=1776 /DNA_ORIENTATION=+ /assembly_acc=CAM_ASM_000359